MSPKIQDVECIVEEDSSKDLEDVFPVVLVDSLVIAIVYLEVSVSVFVGFFGTFPLKGSRRVLTHSTLFR